MPSGIPRKSLTVGTSDTVNLKQAGTLYVGVEGDINVLLQDDTDSDTPGDGRIYKNVQGDFPRVVKKIFATSTTATNIILDMQSGS